MGMIRQWIERMRNTLVDARRTPRRPERQSAVLTANGVDHHVRLVDLSDRGAMIEGGASLREGTRVTLRLLDREPLGGQVRWSHDGRIGLRFDMAETKNGVQDEQ